MNQKDIATYEAMLRRHTDVLDAPHEEEEADIRRAYRAAMDEPLNLYVARKAFQERALYAVGTLLAILDAHREPSAFGLSAAAGSRVRSSFTAIMQEWRRAGHDDTWLFLALRSAWRGAGAPRGDQP